MIDSDLVIDHLTDLPDARLLLDQLSSEATYVSIITYIEVFQGTLRDASGERRQKLRRFLEQTPVLPLTIDIAERCARIREQLRMQRRRTGSRALDLIVAATAIDHDYALVTRNQDDFRDIPGLRLYQAPAPP